MKTAKNIFFSLLTFLIITVSAHPEQTAALLMAAGSGYSMDMQKILYQDGLAYVIEKESSTFKTSLLIIPKKLYKNLDELNLNERSGQQLLAHLMWLAQHFGSKLKGNKNYRITINNGAAIQDCPYLSLLLESDGLITCL